MCTFIYMANVAADFDEELNYKGHVVKVVFKDAVMNENERDEEHIAVRYLRIAWVAGNVELTRQCLG